MPMTVTAPGVYDAIPEADYHLQLTPEPSLSSSFAREMSKTCPKKAWFGSYLNPNPEPDNNKNFDIGKAAHLIFLEPEQFAARTVVIDAENYTTKAAQAARDDAYKAGKAPLLPKHVEQISGMHAALMADPVARMAFADGKPEQTFVAKCPETGIWVKARTDWRPHHGRWLVDYKTAASIEPEAFARAIWEQRYFMQDPFYRDVVAWSGQPMPERFWFVAQEKDPPYLVIVYAIDAKDIERGRYLNSRARWNFAECLATGKWPGYAESAVMASLPIWARNRIEDMTGGETVVDPKPSPELLKRMAEWQRPHDERKAS